MSRQYDLVLLGATGFTGKLTAEYIHQHFPADLKWAIAGRSKDKLSSIITELQTLKADRAPPAIETTTLDKDQVKAVSSKSKVLVNTIGPYNRYSTPIIEACVETSTHYLDVTGEAPWVAKMVRRFQDAAKASGTILIPQCGVESSPADVLTYVLATTLRKRTNQHVHEVMVSLSRFDGTASGGTLASALGLFEDFSPLELQRSTGPSGHLPPHVTLPASPPSAAGILRTLTGLRSIPDLGIVGLPMLNGVDIPVVQRTWALLQEGKQPEAYGPNFRFSAGMGPSGYIRGLIINIAAVMGPLLLMLPPFRWLLQRVVPKPGTGPSKQSEAKGAIEQRGVATADEGGSGGTGNNRVVGSYRWKGGLYALTGVVVAEAAATLIYDMESTFAKKIGGGMCTPATLGERYVERLRDAGVKIDANYVER